MSEVFDLKETETSCLNPGCDTCKPEFESETLKSLSSEINSESTISSGRSLFSAREETQQLDVLPDLEDLKDRLTPAQFERLRGVLLQRHGVCTEQGGHGQAQSSRTQDRLGTRCNTAPRRSQAHGTLEGSAGQ